MSFSNKSDVKNHLSSRHHGQIHLHPPASPPETTDLSGEEHVRADAESAIEELSRQSGSAEGKVTPTENDAELRTVSSPAISKSVQE